MTSPLLSSPKEEYLTHIKRVKEHFKVIYPIFESNLVRILHSENIREALYKMVIFHDLGKLAEKWQNGISKGWKLPAHAPIGAAYLYKILQKEVREPISFAVAIHHADKGLLGDNIERPDAQAITDGIIDQATNMIRWGERVRELGSEYFPAEVEKVGIDELKTMARGLRVWARGCNLIEQHTRRMQMSLSHHILKLCDISAAFEREKYKKKIEDHFGGWLMARDIKNYTENIAIRKRAIEVAKLVLEKAEKEMK